MNLRLNQRQSTILSIALTNLYDQIAKSGEGEQMKSDIMEISKLLLDCTTKAEKEDNDEYVIEYYGLGSLSVHRLYFDNLSDVLCKAFKMQADKMITLISITRQKKY